MRKLQNRKKQKIWHSPKEEPEEEVQLLVYINMGLTVFGSYYKGQFIVSGAIPRIEDRECIDRWAYMRDIEAMK